MPPAITITLGALLISLLVCPALSAYAPPTAPASRPFRYETDTFSFANETVWNYVNGSVQSESSRPQDKRTYTRHCFIVTRAAVQFWKFARFDSKTASLSDDHLAARIREVTERSVWLPTLTHDQR